MLSAHNRYSKAILRTVIKSSLFIVYCCPVGLYSKHGAHLAVSHNIACVLDGQCRKGKCTTKGTEARYVSKATPHLSSCTTHIMGPPSAVHAGWKCRQ